MQYVVFFVIDGANDSPKYWLAIESSSLYSTLRFIWYHLDLFVLELSDMIRILKHEDIVRIYILIFV